MTRQITHVALVKDGSMALSQHQRQNIGRFLSKQEGNYIQMTMREQGKPRSLNQNAYYHSVIVQMLADELGYDHEDMHEVLKWEFLPRQFIKFRDKQIEVAKSTTRLATGEFEEYLDRIRVFAASELGVTIPLPHESA